MFLVRGVQAGVQAAEAQRVLRLAQAAGVVQNQVPTAGPLNHHYLCHEKDDLATIETMSSQHCSSRRKSG